MSSLIVFLLVSAICVVLEARRHRGHWAGTPVNGVLVRRGGPPWRRSVELGVPIAGAAEFVIRHETPLDKLSKDLDVAAELQTGDAKFDRRAYVLSDDPSVQAMLTGDARLTREILWLLQAPGMRAYRLHELVCRAGTVRAVFHRAEGRADLEGLVAWAAPHVVALGAAIPFVAEHRRNDPGFTRSIALLGVSTGLAVNGLIQAGLLAFGTLPATLDVGALWGLAAAFGGGIALVLGTASLLLLHRTARAHGVLLETVAFALVGGTATMFAELHAINVGTDDSPAERAAATVQAVREWPVAGRLDVDVIQQGSARDGSHTLTVARDAFGDLAPGDALVLVVRDGALRTPWIEGVERAPRLGAAGDAAPQAPEPPVVPAVRLEVAETDWASCRLDGAPVPPPGSLLVVDGRPRSRDGVPLPIPPHVRVHVDVGGEVTLLLTAPDTVHWHLHVAPGSRVAGIVATGRFPQTVSGAGDAPVLTRSTALGHACGRSWLAAGALTLPLDQVTRAMFGRAHDRVVRVDGDRAILDRGAR